MIEETQINLLTEDGNILKPDCSITGSLKTKREISAKPSKSIMRNYVLLSKSPIYIQLLSRKEKPDFLNLGYQGVVHDTTDLKILGGLLPICSHCKKIRDDKGYWSQVENYISRHSRALFSHGICPDCVKKYYPQMLDFEK